MVISRGDIYWAELGPAVGSRPAKRRPVVVIQAEPYNSSRLETVLVAAITSNTALAALPVPPDVVLLDPMFPVRGKSAAVKKKFQLLQRLERPCDDEAALLCAARAACPKKIVVKRPAKGAPLAGEKPDYSISGKAIRYDCYVRA